MPTLLGIEKMERNLAAGAGEKSAKINARILIKLSSAARYSVSRSGARIDVFFQKSSVASAFRNLAEDDTLSKTTLQRSGGNVLLSMIFKKDIKSITNYFLIDELNKYNAGEKPPESDHILLVLDLEWLKDSGAARPRMLKAAAASRLGDRAQLAYSAASWPDFFLKYEPLVPLRPIADISVPPFSVLPPARGAEHQFLAEIVAAGRNGDLGRASEAAASLSGAHLSWEQEEALRVLQTEILVRQNSDQNASTLFGPKAEKLSQPAIAGSMSYLKALFHARKGNLHLAQAYLNIDKGKIAKAEHLAFHAHILEAELYLALGTAQKALAFLKGWESRNHDEERLRKLRFATALAATGDDVQAAAFFDAVTAEDARLIERFPSATTMYAMLLQKKGAFREAARLFALAARALEKDSTSKAESLRRQALALLLQKDEKDAQEARKILQLAAQTAPGTEGSERARMKTNDLAASMITTIENHSDQDIAWLLGVNVLTIKKDVSQYAREYKKKLAAIQAEYLSLAQSSLVRDIREEAWFKRALFTSLSGDPAKAVQILGDFFKNFNKADVMEYALLLQAQILPQVINNFANDSDYIKAITLAEKNREILLSKGQNHDYLLDLARSFDSLGLYDRAARVYRFLFNSAASVEETAAYYPPFAMSSLQAEDAETLQKIVDDYAEHFPGGPERQHLLSMMLRLHEKNGRLKEAISLIDGERAPFDSRFVAVAARIFWKEKRNDRITYLFEGMDPRMKNSVPAETMMFYAEALLNTGNPDSAQNAFGLLLDKPEFREQALFRLAGIHIQKSEKEPAVKLLRELTDKGKNKRWKRLAQEELYLLESQPSQPKTSK